MAYRQDHSLLAPVLNTIERFLTTHEEKFFLEQTQRLARDNNKLRRDRNKEHTTGFIFDGVAYVLPEHDFSNSALTGLETELEYEMEALLQNQKQRNQEVRQISMSLFLLCKDHVNTAQDLRDILPECLTPAFPEFAQIERERPSAFPFEADSPMMVRWQRILPRIEYYTATRMLY